MGTQLALTTVFVRYWVELPLAYAVCTTPTEREGEGVCVYIVCTYYSYRERESVYYSYRERGGERVCVLLRELAYSQVSF